MLAHRLSLIAVESGDGSPCTGYAPPIPPKPGLKQTMKFFADTAEIAEIRELAETGLLDGVTTNPSLIHKSGRDFIEVVARDRRHRAAGRCRPKSSRSIMRG